MSRQNRVAEKCKRRQVPAQPKQEFSSCAEWKIATVREEPMRGSVSFEDPERVRDFWVDVISRCQWYHEDKEHLVCICLDVKYKIKGFSLIAIGSLNESIAHPREIFRAAVIAAAYCIIIAHNHPSGDATPSTSDIALTRKLSAVGDILQIPLLDHVIVSDQPTSGSRDRSFRSIRGCFPSWPPRPSELDDWRDEQPSKKRSEAKCESRSTPGLVCKATKADPLATVSEDRKINILLTNAQALAMKKANAFGSIKMFVDTASDSQLEQLRTATPVLFTMRSDKTWLLAVRDLQPHESPSPWEAIIFQRALIDAAVARVSVSALQKIRKSTVATREEI